MGQLMNENKRQRLYEVLMMPIRCTKYSEGNPAISSINGVIETTQTYYPYKEWDGKKIEISLDPDMSDFSIGFYEIIYKELLGEKTILNNKDGFTNKEFAGDTMNSFNTIANLVQEAGPSREERAPMEEWPKWLKKYYYKYHCLANFWLVPMHIGRTSKNTPDKFKEWSKTSYKYNTEDYMDRFLKLYKANLEQYKTLYPRYFEDIDSFKEFARLHILVGSYVSDNMEVYEFSNGEYDRKAIVDKIEDNIKLRAEAISKSKYAEELWEYFFKNGLLGFKETYLEHDEYPLNKERHPYAYECPKCNRIIVNDENYSIPPVCNECSKRD